MSSVEVWSLALFRNHVSPATGDSRACVRYSSSASSQPSGWSSHVQSAGYKDLQRLNRPLGAAFAFQPWRKMRAREDAELRWSVLRGGKPGRTELIKSVILLMHIISAFRWAMFLPIKPGLVSERRNLLKWKHCRIRLTVLPLSYWHWFLWGYCLNSVLWSVGHPVVISWSDTKTHVGNVSFFSYYIKTARAQINV